MNKEVDRVVILRCCEEIEHIIRTSEDLNQMRQQLVFYLDRIVEVV
jgi:hypothetical protein